MAMTQKDVIKKFMRSLVNSGSSHYSIDDILDSAIKSCSKYTGIKDVVNHIISDCKKASSADDFLLNYCGINLNNEDTGAITGSDAGGSKIKTATSIVPETGSAKYPSSTTFTKRGLTVNVPEKNTLTKDEQAIVQGLYSWWIEEALRLIEESYGISFQNSLTTINIDFFDQKSTSTSAYVSWGHNLHINVGQFAPLSSSDVNGSAKTDFIINNDGVFNSESEVNFLDRVIAHELTHVIMWDQIQEFGNLPDFISEGMAELTHGIDDERDIDIKNLASDPSTLDYYLDEDNYYMGAPQYSYAAGYIFFRYLAYQVANNYTAGTSPLNDTSPSINITNFAANTLVSGSQKDDTITNYRSDVTIKGGDGEDYIENRASNVIIYGENDNDHISILGINVTVDGGAGDDYISVDELWLKNSVIMGGTGNDTINNTVDRSKKNLYKYTVGDGNDVIQGYKTTDTINISGAKYSTEISGQDVIIKVKDGSITLKNSTNKQLNIEGVEDTSKTSSGSEDYSENGFTSTTLIVIDSTNSPIIVDSNIKTIYASTRTSAVKITGNSLANTIYGGKGNDTLTGGSGADVFIYASGGGKDVITDYTAGQDKIKITGAKISKTSVSGSDVILTVGSGNIRVKNGKDKKLSLYNNANSLTTTLSVAHQLQLQAAAPQQPLQQL